MGLAKGTCLAAAAATTTTAAAAAAILSCLPRFLVVSLDFLFPLTGAHLLCLVTATAFYPVNNKKNKKTNNANPTRLRVSTTTAEGI